MAQAEDLIRRAVREKLGETAVSVREFPGGANSRTFVVATAGGRRCLAKRYLPRRGDSLQRLRTEYGALCFFGSRGVPVVPATILALPRHRIALYEFVRGARPAAGSLGAREVRQAADFLETLHRLAGDPGARVLPAAKEACFSLDEHLARVAGRWRRLAAVAETDSGGALRAFLSGELWPFLELARAHLLRGARWSGLRTGARLRRDELTLSPSDFGFHNTLRRRGGELVFLDFEYFGWDDPAKMTADFLLTPQVPLPPRLRRPFFERVRGFLGPDRRFPQRLALLYPLLAAKWCLIMLNAFLGERRCHDPAEEARRRVQLARARAFLERARREFAAGKFPYTLT